MPLYAGEWGERRVGGEAEEGNVEDDFDGFDSEEGEDEAAEGEDEQVKGEGSAYEEPASPVQPRRRRGRRLVPAEGLSGGL